MVVDRARELLHNPGAVAEWFSKWRRFWAENLAALESENDRRKAASAQAHIQKTAMGEARWAKAAEFQQEYEQIRKDAADMESVWAVVTTAFEQLRGLRAVRVQSGMLGAAVAFSGLNVFSLFPKPGEVKFSDEEDYAETDTDSSSY